MSDLASRRSLVRMKLAGTTGEDATDAEIDEFLVMFGDRLDAVDQAKYRILRRRNDPSTATTERRPFP